MKKNKLLSSLLVGSLISVIFIITALLFKKEVININLYVYSLFYGLPLLLGSKTESYFLFNLSILVFWNLATVCFNYNITKKLKFKIIIILSLIVINTISAYLCFNEFRFS